jgi:hypothetical protein
MTGSPAVAGEVTFNCDVLPILQKNCQTCHRPGEAAPMSFLTYPSTRPWAKAIKEAVLTRRMPPWSADPRYGHFANDRTLKQSEIRTFVAWADGGAPEGGAPREGNPDDKPAAVEWPDGWTIKPDLIVSLPNPFDVPASGVVEIVETTIPSGFKKDTWVTSIEIRPGNRAVVHHADLFIVRHDKNVEYGVPRIAEKQRDADRVQVQRIQKKGALQSLQGLDAIYVPGAPPADYRLYDAAMLIPAGSDLTFQVHYTPNGTSTTDQTRIGFTLAKEEPKRRIVTLVPTALRDEEHFRIPAGDPNWECRMEVKFNRDAELIWFLPHMHLRGKDMTYRLLYPSGESEVALSVKYDFNWQLSYEVEKPILVPKGTKLQATAHFDNSPNNRFNPDPRKDVWWGDQTWEEMMIPYFGVIVDRGAKPSKVVRYTAEFTRGAH